MPIDDRPSGPTNQGSGANEAQSLANTLGGLRDETAKIAKTMSDMVATLAELNKGFTTVTKNSREFSNELWESLATSHKTVEKFKFIADYTAKMLSSATRAAPNKKEAIATMRELKNAYDELGAAHPKVKSTREFQNALEELKNSLIQIESCAEDAFNDSVMRDYIRGAQAAQREMRKLAATTNGVRMSGLKQDLHSANATLSRMFGYKDHATKFRDLQKTGADIKEERDERMADRKYDFARKKRHIELAMGDGQTSAEATKSQGFSRLGGSLYKWANSDGQKGGRLSNMALRVLSDGEGKIGKGIGSWGASLLEGGAGGLMEGAGGALGTAAAGLGPVIAIEELVRGLFDKNQMMNAEISEKLSKGGLYTGSGDPVTAMRTMRNNLNGPLYSTLGIGYDKNLAIASAIQDAGYSTQDLFHSDLHQGKGGDGSDFLRGSFGTFQRNVYGYGKAAGLDSSQTMAETIKLVTQYKQSLESTQGFFVQINKDARSAGLTTTKYIQLLDEVNSHYDRSNKLLESTVDTMRLLSVTGRSTAEDITEAMSALTSGGQKRPQDMSAYLYMQTLDDPRSKKLFGDNLQSNYDDSLDNLSSALGKSKEDLGTVINDKGRDAFTDFIVDAQKTAGKDQRKFANINTAIDAARKAFDRNSTFKEAASLSPSEGGLRLSTSGEFEGDDATVQKTLTRQNIRQALTHFGYQYQDLLDPDKRASMKRNTGLMGMLKEFQFNPEQFDKLPYAATSDAAARLKAAKTGDTSEAATDLNKDTYEIAKRHGVHFKAGLAGGAALQEKLSTDAGTKEILQVLSKSEETLDDAFGPTGALKKYLKATLSKADYDNAMNEAAKGTAGTRTSAEIFADAFKSLFNTISTPLDYLAKLLGKVHSSENAKVSADPEALKKFREGFSEDGSGRGDAAVSELQAEIQRYKDTQNDSLRSGDEKSAAAHNQQVKEQMLSRMLKAKNANPDQVLNEDLTGANRDVQSTNSQLWATPDYTQAQASALFEHMGVKFDKNNQATIPNNEWDQYFTRLEKVKDDSGYKFDTTRQKDGTYIHKVTNISVAASTLEAGDRGYVDAKEKPPAAGGSQ